MRRRPATAAGTTAATTTATAAYQQHFDGVDASRPCPRPAGLELLLLQGLALDRTQTYVCHYTISKLPDELTTRWAVSPANSVRSFPDPTPVITFPLLTIRTPSTFAWTMNCCPADVVAGSVLSTAAVTTCAVSAASVDAEPETDHVIPPPPAATHAPSLRPYVVPSLGASVMPPASSTAAVTNAVVAICVLLVPAVAVGAVGAPVSAGEANGALPSSAGCNPVTSSMAWGWELTAYF